MRIVSLLPSATEMVCALGLRDQLVGVSHECDFPSSVRTLPAVTTTHVDHDASSREIDAQVRNELSTNKALYSLRDDILERLKPDLIVTQSLCDVCAVAENDVSVAAANLPHEAQVFNLQPMSLDDVLESVVVLAEMAGQRAAGIALRALLHRRIDIVRNRSTRVPSSARRRVAFIEWVDPPL